MLKTLSSVPWAKREHAYGSATDVPAALRALAGRHDAKRQQAYERLFLSLIDPPRAFDAATEAVPFLIEIASSAKHDRELPLHLLADIASGGHAYRIVSGFDKGDATIAATFVDGAIASQSAVAAHAETLRGLLNDSEPSVRAGASLVLAQLYDTAAVSRDAVAARLEDESDLHARASHCVALGLLGRYLGHKEDEATLQREHDATNGLQRTAAALGLAYLQRDVLHDAVAQTLADAVGGAPVAPRLFPWDEGQVGWHAYALLSAARPETAESTLVAALQRAAQGAQADTSAYDLVAALLRLRMRRFFGRASDPIVPSELTEDLRHVVAALSSFDVQGPFSDYGLPVAAADRRRLVGVDPLGPLDREVEFSHKKKKKRWPLWKVFRAGDTKKLSKKAVGDIMAQLSPRDRLAALADATMRPYGVFSPDANQLTTALNESDAELAGWWPGFAEGLLVRLDRSEDIQAAAASLAMHAAVRSGANISERFRPLLERSIAATTPVQSIAVLEGLHPGLRLALVNKYIDNVAARLSPARALNNALPFLACCHTEEAAHRIVNALVTPLEGGQLDPIDAKKALVAIGSAAKPAIDQALAAGGAAQTDVLKAASKAIK